MAGTNCSFYLEHLPVSLRVWHNKLVMVYFKHQAVTCYIMFSVPENCNLNNREDPDEMLHSAALHLGLHCLPKSLFPIYKHKPKT